MSIIKTVTKDEFREAFKRMGRGEQFSTEGLDSLFEYLENEARTWIRTSNST